MPHRVHHEERLHPETGLTIPEVFVSTILVIIVLSIALSGVASVRTITERERSSFAQVTTAREVLDEIARDLDRCSLNKDPLTNQYRFSITNNADSDEIVFRVIDGATVVGGEVTPVWSSDIRIHVDTEGRAIRTQDGTTRILGTGVRSLRFKSSLLGHFSVTVTTVHRHENTSGTQEKTLTRVIRPEY